MSEQSDEWSLVFYVSQGGESPVEDFLESLDSKTRARFDWAIEQLLVRNVLAREPLVKHIEGPIWELRRESNTNIYRIFYALLPRNRVLMLHAIQKKTQKTQRREIVRAIDRYEDWISKRESERQT